MYWWPLTYLVTLSHVTISSLSRYSSTRYSDLKSFLFMNLHLELPSKTTYLLWCLRVRKKIRWFRVLMPLAYKVTLHGRATFGFTRSSARYLHLLFLWRLLGICTKGWQWGYGPWRPKLSWEIIFPSCAFPDMGVAMSFVKLTKQATWAPEGLLAGILESIRILPKFPSLSFCS
jgi:hypothetical protein